MVSDPPLWPCRSGQPLGGPEGGSTATGKEDHASTAPLSALSRRRHIGTCGSDFGDSLSSGMALPIAPSAHGQVVTGGGTAGAASLPAEQVVLDRKAAPRAAR